MNNYMHLLLDKSDAINSCYCRCVELVVGSVCVVCLSSVLIATVRWTLADLRGQNGLCANILEPDFRRLSELI